MKDGAPVGLMRTLRVIDHLRRKPASVKGLAKEYGTHPRTIERLFETLREVGYVIEPDEDEWYRITKGPDLGLLTPKDEPQNNASQQKERAPADQVA